MHFQRFTEEQVNNLRSNPYVEAVTDKRITYSREFKDLFISRYQDGIEPRQIFIEAGFDVQALGYKRIERASSRWRGEHNESLTREDPDYIDVHEKKRKHSIENTTVYKQAMLIKQLQTENRMLREKIEAIRATTQV